MHMQMILANRWREWQDEWWCPPEPVMWAYVVIAGLTIVSLFVLMVRATFAKKYSMDTYFAARGAGALIFVAGIFWPVSLAVWLFLRSRSTKAAAAAVPGFEVANPHPNPAHRAASTRDEECDECHRLFTPAESRHSWHGKTICAQCHEGLKVFENVVG